MDKPERVLAITVSAVLILSLIPVLVVAFFNHPSADDYSFGINTARAWRENGSLWETAKAAGETVGIYYQGWQGTWSAVFLFTLQPDVFGVGYWFGTFLLLAVFCASTLFLSRELLVNMLGTSRAGWILLSLPPLGMMIHCLPSATQAFFWWNGSIFYTFFFSLSLFYLTLLLRLLRHPVNTGRGALIGSGVTLTGAIIGGGNYSAALAALLVSGALIICLAARKDKRFLRLLCPAFFLFAGFMVSIAAPGNAVRAQLLDGMGPVEAVLQSFRYGAEHFWEWTTPGAVCVLLLLTPFGFHAAKRSGLSFRYPALVSVCSFCLFASLFTPPLYAMGSPGPGRLINMAYYAFWWMLLINVIYWSGWMATRFPKQAPLLLKKAAIPIAAVILLLFSVFTWRERMEHTGYLALRSLWNGEASAYDAECRERRSVLKSAEGGDIRVDPLTVRPKPLYFSDMTGNPDVWPNTAIAQYYDLESVSLK